MQRATPREVKPEDIGWLAGIIDGEASITFVRPKSKKMTAKIIYSIHIVSANIPTLNKCIRIVNHFDDGKGKLARLYKKKYKKSAFIKSQKDCYHLQIYRQGVLRNLLPAILPHLTEKHLKAARLLNFLENHEIWQTYKEGEVDSYFSFTPVETERTALHFEEMKRQSEPGSNVRRVSRNDYPAKQ